MWSKPNLNFKIKCSIYKIISRHLITAIHLTVFEAIFSEQGTWVLYSYVIENIMKYLSERTDDELVFECIHGGSKGWYSTLNIYTFWCHLVFFVVCRH